MSSKKDLSDFTEIDAITGQKDYEDGADPSKAEYETTWINTYAAVLILIWTVLISASFLVGRNNAHNNAEQGALIQARTAFEKDVIYRRWNSQSGVYATISDKLRPNMALPWEQRDIQTEYGFTLTKINPAYMTRLANEMGNQSSGLKGRIASLKPKIEENRADPWETSALSAMERNPDMKEKFAIISAGGKNNLRYMGALEAEESCITCHQDYKLGSLRGGISIDVPMDPFLTAARSTVKSLAFSHSAIWLLGLLTFIAGARQMTKRINERDKAQRELEQLATELEGRIVERTSDVRARQRQLQAFMDHTAAAVYIKNTNHEFIMVNNRLAELFGTTAAKLVQANGSDIIPAEIAKRFHEGEVEVLRTMANVQTEMFTGEGSTINPHSAFFFPIINTDEHGRHYLESIGCIMLDISQQKRMEEALVDAKNAAERANKAKSDFLANMSHEIRTPLNGVIGMADLLMRTTLSADQSSMIATVKNAGNNLLAVLNDVLDFSKIEAGKMSIVPVPFGLRDTVFDTVKGLAPIAYKKKLELIVHISPQVPDYLEGDSQRIHQILLNLLSNAIKFTEDGEITVTVSLQERTDDTVKLRFSVRDTGIGIPPEKQKLIFAAFEQADSSTTRKYGGTGLGLAISSRLAELMHGSISMESTPGEGSVFWLDIPLPCLDEVAPAKPMLSVKAIQGYNALIVDDNETNRTILSEQLSSWNMKNQACASVDDAMQALRAAEGTMTPFDLILSDMHMPDKDGADLARMLRDDPSFASMPIILLTSGSLDFGEDAPEFQGTLVKPVKPDELMRAISSAMGIWESMGMDELQEEVLKDSRRTSGFKLKVLLVEDMEMNQLVATRMLNDLGHEVKVASNGQVAIDMMENERFDIVFMDIQMPVMDGVQATKLIREKEENGAWPGHMPLVAMTAHALKDDKQKYLDSGMDAYLSKPVLLSDLAETIEEVAIRFSLVKVEDLPDDLDDESEGEGEQDGGDDKPDAKDEPKDGGATAEKEESSGKDGGSDREKDKKDAKSGDDKKDGAKDAKADKTEKPDARKADDKADTGKDEKPGKQDKPGKAAEAGSLHDEEDEEAFYRNTLNDSFGGDKELMRTSMKIFMRDAPGLLTAIMQAVKSGNNDEIALNAHALKGIAGYYTKGALYDLCFDFEKAGRDNALPGKRTELEDRFATLEARVKALQNRMDKYIKNNED